MEARVKATFLRSVILSGVSLLCVPVLPGDGPASAQGAPSALVIRGGTLVDGNGGTPVPNSVIVIEGNRIAAVGRAGEVAVPAGAQVIDAAGKWVMPGLIDAKANWNWFYGEAFLHWGVTSAMVTGARNDQGIAERDAIDHGIFPGPRIYQGVTNAKGGGANGQNKDRYVPGGGQRWIYNAEQARALVRSNIAGGADFLGSNDGDGPPEMWAAYADEAHKAGKGVVMRCLGPQTRGKECVLAGADVMIHTGEIGDQIAKNPEVWKDYVGEPSDPYCDMDPAKEKDMIQFLLQHDTAVEPDFMAMDRSMPKNWKRVQQEDRDVFDDPNLRAYYPEFAIRDLQDNVQSAEDYMKPDRLALRACGFENHAKFIGDLVAAGGHAVVGSDITQSAPGLGVHQEMAVFQEDAHVAPMKILQATTKWVAQHFRIKDIGTVEVGKLADIDIVEADPTADILNMRKLSTVIKDGKIVDRSYHAWYRGWMFSNDKTSYDSLVVSDPGWVAAMKRATSREEPKTLVTVTAPTGGKVAIEEGLGDMRRGPGLGPVPDPTLSPTPGIETLFPHTIIQGAPDTEFTLTGVHFVKRSVVYANGEPVPTNVASGTRLTFRISRNLLAEAGKIHVVVKNPEPMTVGSQIWGNTSNTAHILVPFSFTTAWSHNAY
jgi:hypothetical protein